MARGYSFRTKTLESRRGYRTINFYMNVASGDSFYVEFSIKRHLIEFEK